MTTSENKKSTFKNKIEIVKMDTRWAVWGRTTVNHTAKAYFGEARSKPKSKWRA